MTTITDFEQKRGMSSIAMGNLNSVAEIPDLDHLLKLQTKKDKYLKLLANGNSQDASHDEMVKINLSIMNIDKEIAEFKAKAKELREKSQKGKMPEKTEGKKKVAEINPQLMKRQNEKE